MVLGNMTTIEAQDSQDLTETENSFNFFPVQKERYKNIINTSFIYAITNG